MIENHRAVTHVLVLIYDIPTNKYATVDNLKEIRCTSIINIIINLFKCIHKIHHNIKFNIVLNVPMILNMC